MTVFKTATPPPVLPPLPPSLLQRSRLLKQRGFASQSPPVGSRLLKWRGFASQSPPVSSRLLKWRGFASQSPPVGSRLLKRRGFASQSPPVSPRRQRGFNQHEKQLFQETCTGRFNTVFYVRMLYREIQVSALRNPRPRIPSPRKGWRKRRRKYTLLTKRNENWLQDP